MGALLVAAAVFISTVFVGEGTRRKSETRKLRAEIAALKEGRSK